MSKLLALWRRLSPQARRASVGGGIIVLALAVVVAAVVSADDGKDEETVAPTTTVASTTTTLPVTTTTEPATGPVAPLTGLRTADASVLTRSALVVKIDNLDGSGTDTAIPQSGLPKADVVFEEMVEGGITRLVTVFHSTMPGSVGPVRSARTTDLAILPQLGRPLLAWSGGNAGVTGAVRSNPSLIDVGFDAASGSYRREGSRRAPHNLYVNADELFAKAPQGNPAPVPLFAYRTDGEKNPDTAAASGGVDIAWRAAPVSWRWDGKLRLYVRTQRGHPHVDADGTPIAAKNVVVLVTPYGQSPADARSPEALTVGRGELFVYTNGRVIHGTWDRPDVAKPATLADDAGLPVKLSPGQTWIELPPSGMVTTVG